MKKYFLFLLGWAIAISVRAQVSVNAVTFTIDGINDVQLTIDGNAVPATNTTITGNRTIFAVSNLQNGQHNFQIIRNNQDNRRRERVNSIFNLRAGFAMRIKLNPNGSLELIETKAGGIGSNSLPMDNANFNILLQNVRNQRSAMGRRNLISSTFSNNANYFTCQQVSQLLQQVNGENSRLDLAKLSYHSITDRDNFYLIYDLFNSQTSRDDLQNYVDNYHDNYDLHTAMPDADFNALYQRIRQQWPVSTQVNSLNSAFNNTNNYFTCYQASQLIQLVNSDANRLPLAKLSYRSITDRENFNRVAALLNYQSSRDELTAYVNNFTGGNNNNTGGNNNNNYGAAMPDVQFNNLYQTIRQQWPVSTQINSLNSAFNNTNNYFTSYQASQLIQLVSGDANRLPLAKLSYRSITDRENFNRVADLLNYQTSRDELTAYINNFTGGHNNNYGTAMPEAQFNSLYQSIQAKFLPNEKMSALTDLFTSTNDHFSCAQAKQLIALVTFENNRLQLAKLSYRTIIDRTSFSQLYDLFSSQSSRDELDAYIRSYRD